MVSGSPYRLTLNLSILDIHPGCCHLDNGATIVRTQGVVYPVSMFQVKGTLIWYFLKQICQSYESYTINYFTLEENYKNGAPLCYIESQATCVWQGSDIKRCFLVEESGICPGSSLCSNLRSKSSENICVALVFSCQLITPSSPVSWECYRTFHPINIATWAPWAPTSRIYREKTWDPKNEFITPPSAARGGLKENGQNPDSGSKNSENQNNDAIS